MDAGRNRPADPRLCIPAVSPLPLHAGVVPPTDARQRPENGPATASAHLDVAYTRID
jgi:hypothetical protein